VQFSAGGVAGAAFRHDQPTRTDGDPPEVADSLPQEELRGQKLFLVSGEAVGIDHHVTGLFRNHGDDQMRRGASHQSTDNILFDIGQALVALSGRRETGPVGRGDIRLGEPLGRAAAAQGIAQRIPGRFGGGSRHSMGAVGASWDGEQLESGIRGAGVGDGDGLVGDGRRRVVGDGLPDAP
jgi:hypothetical protein